MTPADQILLAARTAGCPEDQVRNFMRAGIVLQPKQWEMAAAARSCDSPDGPVSVGVGGARGGSKSHWMISQLAADDCQRYPNLKCLWLRKVGKANKEHLEDLTRTTLKGIPHNYRSGDGTITFSNKSRIICGHYQNESDIDAYLGLEYDIVAIEEATTLQESKYKNIRTCCRSSKRGWRPRDYSTTNPGGIGHSWYKKRFILPLRAERQFETRFIPARCTDNKFNNPEYIKVLEELTGWQRRAWLEGDWDISAGQFFTNWREDKHVIDHFDDRKAMTWFCAFDYGFSHYSVCLLFAVTGDGQIVVVDEHAARGMVPSLHVQKIREMLAKHSMTELSKLEFIVAGSDIFATESDGSSIARDYSDLGLTMTCAEMDRINGWGKILHLLGDPYKEPFFPKLLVHRRCSGLIERIPLMLHDPNRPEDVDKVDCDEEGQGGDDHPDCLRYGIASYQASKPLKWAAPFVMPQPPGASA